LAKTLPQIDWLYLAANHSGDR